MNNPCYVYLTISLLITTCFFNIAKAQLGDLIPASTATHTAVQSGAWFDANTWDVGTIPGDAAIVYIPQNIHVEYQGCSDAHVFSIRVDGDFTCTPISGSEPSCLTFDTFIGLHMSFVKFLANQESEDRIEVTIRPFDIEAHKAGISTFNQAWNLAAEDHFSDGAPVDQVIREVIGARRYNSYQEAILGDTEVIEVSRSSYDDGLGVTGRYQWDPDQLSLGMVLMGQVEIIGHEKLAKTKLSENLSQGQQILQVEDIPTGWQVGDEILITRGGNISTLEKGEDEATISVINGTTININEGLLWDHPGRPEDDLHCYVGNLSRSITFKSTNKNQIHQRGHFMAMHNNTNIQIRNTAFIDMGRTDKSRLIDDFIWDKWIEPKVFKSKISPLGQEICQMKKNAVQDITNTRGRYSIHLHKTGAKHTDNMVSVTGNVVWGNPGWGITHHDSYADISRNVVYQVTGAGIVSETGSELGFWDDNLVVGIEEGHGLSPYDATVFHDDYLFSGQGLGMKGRGVLCRNNVIVKAKQGVGVINMNPSVTNHDRVDPLALATFRPGYEFDQFPLSRNGYSIEGDGVMPVEVALIMENTTVIECQMGLRSIERDMGLNHESRSVFDGFFAWGVRQGFSITYQADYSFKDIFISGDGNNNSVGAFLWKHSHNQTFENIKMADLSAAILVSRLVESGNGLLKTRNNGVTPWVFVELELENVEELYRIEKEDPGTNILYTEHSDNTIHLSSEDVSNRPLTFTILDTSPLEVDLATEDFHFSIDGIITDDFGSYPMGTDQAVAQGTLRLSYPERIYEFASREAFEAYLAENGVFKDEETEEIYFIIEEYLPNRRTFEHLPFPVRVRILNAPNSGVYANPQTESASNPENQSRLVSRFAVGSQSSTQMGITYDEAAIDAAAWKAIDGNLNGRINCQIFQRDLLPVGSFAQTQEELEPWYELDLRKNTLLEYIDLWNTVELNGAELAPPSDHFKDFYILISDTPFGDVGLEAARAIADYEYYIPDNGPVKRKISLENLQISGRYIRIQAVGISKIKIAEIEVIGKNDNYIVNTEALELSKIKVFPNPSMGTFNIEYPAKFIGGSMSVFDLTGKLLFSERILDDARMELSLNLPVGLYYLRINREEEQIVQPIIIQ